MKYFINGLQLQENKTLVKKQKLVKKINIYSKFGLLLNQSEESHKIIILQEHNLTIAMVIDV